MKICPTANAVHLGLGLSLRLREPTIPNVFAPFPPVAKCGRPSDSHLFLLPAVMSFEPGTAFEVPSLLPG